MDFFKLLKMYFWKNVFVIFALFFQVTLCIDDQKVKLLFEEYGFNVTKNISLLTDLPFWGQTPESVEKSCIQVENHYMTTLIYYNTTPLQYYGTGIKDAIDFLCTKENLRDYKSYMSCFANNEVNGVFKTCRDWRDSAIRSFNDSDMLDSNQTKCSIEDVYQSCTMSMLQSFQSCGKNASKWFDSWWRKLNYYYHLSISCISPPDNKSSDGDSDEWSIILGIILAVTACLLVVGIIVFVVFLFTRRKLNASDEDPTQHGRRGFGQRREVPPPYALVVETPGDSTVEGDSSSSAGALRLVDRENRTVVENEARLYDGNISSAPGNGLILPPPYSGSGPPPDVFAIEGGGRNEPDSDKEDEFLSMGTSTTQCSSINLHACDSVQNVSSGRSDDPRRNVDGPTSGRTRGSPLVPVDSLPDALPTEGAETPVKNTSPPLVRVIGLTEGGSTGSLG